MGFIIGCGALTLMTGCAETVHPVPTDVDASGMPNAELALQRSMDRVDAAMRALGGMNVATQPGEPSPVAIPAELQRPVSFAWSGPIDAAAKALADRIGYRLVVTSDGSPGKPASLLPVVVSVNKTNVRIVEVFQALGDSAGPKATVIVDPDHRQVDVQHHV